MKQDLKRSILIVDDDPDSRSLLKIYTRQLGFRDIQCAVDGDDACKKLAGKNYNVVLTDLYMPNMNGFELLARSRQAHLNSIFILYTAKYDKDIADQGTAAGANFVVSKSNNLVKLRDALTDSMD